MTSSATTMPEGWGLRALLLIDAEHLDVAREVIRSGDPSLAMVYGSGDDKKAVFTVNDVEHRARFDAEPMDEEMLRWSVNANVLWHVKDAPYPHHTACVLVRRDLGKDKLSNLLAFTEVLHALTRKIPTHAIAWLPYTVVNMAMFEEVYDLLYKNGTFPIYAWTRFAYSSPGGQLMVRTYGLATIGLMDVEFHTNGDTILMDVGTAAILIAHMLATGDVLPDGATQEVNLDVLQASIKMSHRPSCREEGETVCFLEISRFPGGRPLPGVH
ncbi:hypothetical protein [Xanthobacter sp.]|uniref:hypothetical protein n=1 Tax=Xanthobacter sp. TaxID=35809 RepID=UPI0025F10AB2|nr:hypothetical protein [Xanthobacter sp.]